ncbi:MULTISPECIES: hypothetical protein [unclassified Rhizobium]|uniref:hypothetical protein n=1 Tax=unclassified Rhizobium TaxID=2613769 RepID=UPI000714196F|nr:MULTISPECIES: hypothetical protein [unclassified Rhizobium]KQT03205.1 hypothetical protein ASG42_24670 [Rhizobium sp. Leaf391]KQU08400.1 hypothetical protein ASG68_22690 [Rhizobium sp. Leaf453]
MKLKALDSFYSSETKQVHAGQVFEVESEERGKEFVKRGLAAVEGEPKAVKKAAAEPENKAAAEPDNKAASKPTKGEK